jgi:hypothetical protein
MKMNNKNKQPAALFNCLPAGAAFIATRGDINDYCTKAGRKSTQGRAGKGAMPNGWKPDLKSLALC